MLQAFLLSVALTLPIATSAPDQLGAPSTVARIQTALIPIDTDMVTGPTGESYASPRFTLTPAAWQALAAVRPGVLARWTDFPTPEGGSLELELERLATAASQAGELFVDGRPSGRLITDDIALFQGRVAGVVGSDVYLALSPFGSRGWIRLPAEVRNGVMGPARIIHILAEPGPANDWSNPRLRLLEDGGLGLPPATVCRIDELQDAGVSPGSPLALRGGSQTAPLDQVLDKTLAATPVLRELPIAVETDYDFYQLFGNLGAAQAYAVSLFGAVSARYREQFDTVITLPYLGLYTTPADPWTSQDMGGTSIDLLYEFQAAWYPNMPVDAALGHFLSGAGLGGGVAWLDSLCLPEYRYGVSGNLGGNLPLPVAQGPINWDFVVVAHEIGHNLSTLHTHDYCPPLDECAPSGYFGSCQTQELCITNGTVMSYCHLCSGGLANITTYFHPTVVQTIQARVDDSCLAPYEGLFVAQLGGAQASSSGVPTITANYDATTHELGVSYAHAPNPTAGALIVGASVLNLPVFGGILVPSPDLYFGITTMGPSGSLPKADFSGTSYPTGAKLFLQAWYVDLIAPSGFAASAGLEVELLVPDPPARVDWKQHPTNGKEYALTTSATWFKGQELAHEHGGELASVTNAALELWFKQTFFDTGLASGPVYLGFTDETSENVFYWTNGAPVLFTHWGTGEPNDWNGFEDYTTFAGGAWNDVDGFDALPALIQR